MYGKTPFVSSYLTYCHALNGRDLDTSIELGREALQADPANPEFSLNLDRVLLLSGRKDEAITVFRQELAHPSTQNYLPTLKNSVRANRHYSDRFLEAIF